nr:hypothetical protein [Tanacetum cinerariifolium]
AQSWQVVKRNMCGKKQLNACSVYGTVVDVFIPLKKSKVGFAYHCAYKRRRYGEKQSADWECFAYHCAYKRRRYGEKQSADWEYITNMIEVLQLQFSLFKMVLWWNPSDSPTREEEDEENYTTYERMICLGTQE